MEFTGTNQITFISFKNIDIWPSYGPNEVRMPIFGHTYFGHNSAFFGPISACPQKSGASKPNQKVDLQGQLLSRNHVFEIFRPEAPLPLKGAFTKYVIQNQSPSSNSFDDVSKKSAFNLYYQQLMSTIINGNY